MKTYTLCCTLLLLCACTKTTDLSFLADKFASSQNGHFTTYTIPKGAHYADKNIYRRAQLSELHFMVQFDSSAVYKTFLAENQYDINKLLGFADNNKDHQEYSARFGWRWSDGAIRLFAYVYNAGVLNIQELITVPVGAIMECRIKVTGNQYLFYYGDNWITMPRESTTPVAEGYMLYPYFGGDETAPQDISIRIKNL